MDNEIKKCTFFMENKKRRCKFEVYKDSEFCQHHTKTDNFIICPLDGSHVVLKDRLDDHLLICNKKKFEENLKSQIWFSNKINSTNKDEINNNLKQEKKSTKKLLYDMQEKESEELKILISKSDEIFKKSICLYNENLKSKEYLLTENYLIPDITIEKENISETEKDIKQIRCLIDLMKKFNLIDQDNIYIEFGAGKGNFSHFIAAENDDKSAHILLEKEARRNKQDKNHRENKNFIRIRTDIIDFDIKSIQITFKDFFQNRKDCKVVGVSKHMCGGATDLSINALLGKSKENDNNNLNICISTCCHHRYTYDSYCNLQFLNQINIEEKEIDYFFMMSSWAVTDLFRNKKEKNVENSEEIKENFKNEKCLNKLNSSQKSLIGFKIKRIIDIGRCLYLSSVLNKEILLLKYCEISLSPENFIILCKN